MDAQRLFKSSLARNERVAFYSACFCGLVIHPHHFPLTETLGEAVNTAILQ
jgi:hypothetical protein